MGAGTGMAAVITSYEVRDGVTYIVVAKGTSREDIKELQRSPWTSGGPRCITVPPDITPEENARRKEHMNRVIWRILLDNAAKAEAARQAQAEPDQKGNGVHE